MATAAVVSQPVLAKKRRNFVPIVSTTHATKKCDQPFQPSRHLAFDGMPKVHTMKELGFSETTGVSPIAVSEPFQLFTEEAVHRMRQEVLTPEVFENCQYSSEIAHCYLRGYVNKYAPFIRDVWKHPETLAIVSKVAGIDLVPEMDLEIGHTNVSVQSEEKNLEKMGESVAETIKDETDKSKGNSSWDDNKSIVGWHFDSYPFVAVTMLSDCKDMVGGETALRTGNGDVMKVRGPQMGCAIILQGRYIEHEALRAIGMTERITMVTAFRPRNPLVRDDTVLTTVRTISNINDLYNQFAEYRLQMLEERIRLQLKEIQDLSVSGRRVATKKLKAFLEEQEKFLAHMSKEMVDDEDIVVDKIEHDGLDSSTSSKPNKRQRLT